MKELYELIDREDPGWPLVQQWVKEARNRVEVLPPPDDDTRERALVATQVTTRSPMGSIIYESGGILVDDDQALSFLPSLSEPGPPTPERTRRSISVAEIYSLHVLGG